MSLPAYGDLGKSLFDGKSGLFGKYSTGSTQTVFSFKGADGMKVKGDSTFGSDSSKSKVKFTYPGLGKKPVLGNLEVTAPQDGKLEVAFKGLELGSAGSADISFAPNSKNLSVSANFSKEKFNFDLDLDGKSIDSDKRAFGAKASVVLGDDDVNVGAKVTFADLSSAQDFVWETTSRWNQASANAELFLVTKGMDNFTFAASKKVDANTTLAGSIAFNVKDGANTNTSQFGYKFSEGAATTSFFVNDTGAVKGSYAYKFSDRVKGTLNTGFSLGNPQPKFGYKFEFC